MKNKQRPSTSSTVFLHHFCSVPVWIWPLFSLILVRPTQAHGPQRTPRWHLSNFCFFIPLKRRSGLNMGPSRGFSAFHIKIESSQTLLSWSLGSLPKLQSEWQEKELRKRKNKKPMKLLWGKIYFKTFNMMLYGIPHLVFLHLLYQ